MFQSICMAAETDAPYHTQPSAIGLSLKYFFPKIWCPPQRTSAILGAENEIWLPRRFRQVNDVCRIQVYATLDVAVFHHPHLLGYAEFVCGNYREKHNKSSRKSHSNRSGYHRMSFILQRLGDCFRATAT